ncbi:MAG: cephalosporin hydroxylase family protein [Deltaproteobacteria bacterium]|nr:cephalosporin hydroxylase family protein [Deltaproteobacteria bacterium]
MNPIKEFEKEREERIALYKHDAPLQDAGRKFLQESLRTKYSYNFSWMGRPVIQYPQDLMAMQEIIWRVRPDAIVETGIAHGGSLIFHASMLELLGGPGMVVGIDVDIRAHNRVEIERHPMFKRIVLIEGSSTDEKVVDQVKALVKDCRQVLVCLDSNHTSDHVLQELRLYAPLVGVGSYLVVFDGIIEEMPENTCTNRPWGRGNNPVQATRQFLDEQPNFVPDREIEEKLLITVVCSGYLKRVA